MAQSLKQTLVGLEEKFWTALKDGDVDTAVNLAADPCIVAGAQGVARVDRKTFAGMMKNPGSTIEEFIITDPQVQELSDDVAVIAYKVREKLKVDGKDVDLEAAESSTWVRQNGGWVCAVHTESISGDPYGRDRAG